MACFPVVSFNKSLLDLSLWSFLRFLSELVKEYEGFILKVKIENSIIARSQFPDIFNEMFCYICSESRSVLLQKFNVQGNLLVLDSSILVLASLLLQIVKKFPKL